jgi:four helix bundle protein
MTNYNLRERTAKFGESIIELAKKIPHSSINGPLINQLVRAGTSIGANYCEADNASSKKDFVNRIFFCKKESNETKYWLNLVGKAVKPLEAEAKKNAGEAQELTLIFASIINSCNKPKH